MFLIRLLFQTVFLALGQIWANKGRAVLTSLGIIIGVASVIAVVASLDGMRKYVLDEVATFGAQKMWIWGNVPRELRTTVSWDSVRLNLSEAQRIIDNCPSISHLTPITDGRWDVTAGRITQQSVRVTGIWPEWHEIEDRTVIRGRPFMRIDEDERRQVCLINEKAIEELELDVDPVLDYILIDGRRFLIVGIVETKELGPMFGGGESQSEIFVPYSTAYTMNPYDWLVFMAKLRTPDVAEEAREEIRFALRKARNLGPEDPDTFQMEILQNLIDQFNQIAGVITLIAGGVVSISLLVGGIGIMNIMLVSVSERTREIGLRKAVGAKPSVILMQFLVEAVVLCSFGGAIGISIGQTAILGLRAIPGSPLTEATVPPEAVILAFGFSAGVGIVFGMFPAIKAARLDPIVALRHE